MGIVYLNGTYLPIEEATVSVLDRGFIYGDGVYELVPVYNRKPFRLAEHLVRLKNSMERIRLSNPYSDDEWAAILTRVIALQPFDNQGVYFQVTRGVAKRDHAFPEGVTPTVFMMSNPLATPSADVIANGVACVTAIDERWLNCDIKSISLLGNVLMRQFAADNDAVETVMFRHGFLTEASASNILIVKDGIVLAPPKDRMILPGITYGAIYDFAREGGMKFEIRPHPRIGGVGCRRVMGHVVDQGSRRDRDARRSRSRTSCPRGQARTRIPADAPAVPEGEIGALRRGLQGAIPPPSPMAGEDHEPQ